MNPIRLVPDASVALAWLLGRTDMHESNLARHLLEVAHASQNLVPHIWPVEVANGMLRAERGERITEGQRLSFARLLDRLPISADPDAATSSIWRVYQLARTHGLTTYDASYVELAWRNNACLATFDRKLADAARASGIAVYGQPHGVAEPIARYG
ncbi:tRNA(fMet)-specific endonuclease VapC [Achromobacter deleyi]|uniref:Ribonuclease VapC n=1 Tax=Achromobacter deleyi TaxID=1353891 RepID=A0A6S7A5T4_9BURK|nr:type II toxin-antitoxin system VapC family toxin [Achromobacter deleyi]CAB3676407.1 tRNA(fMet)-specific endonuclease VapC [Achromobacter deleyi]CAB3838983.1 tRNA(fMet)-specific endonuclease VapC [Achromobacter deleyi]CAB3840925.1 tRNA(fMet)-specific endonuclease VapC [Achromobacter deleyi]CAB3918001.1 tRNA(fMet)-specific endonuclease VapC [Achromobacter deleyi]